MGKNLGGWARRVAAAGDDHRRAAAELPFARRCSVVNAGTFEGFTPFGLQTMVIRARRNDDALRQQGGVATLDLQARAVLAVGKCERERLRGRRKLGAETIGLKLRAVSQPAAAHSRGKPAQIPLHRTKSAFSPR